MMFKNTALVLEGGGMQGVYSAGVLDVLHDARLKFGGYAGTSAGATHLCNYLSEQRNRNFRLDTVHSKSFRYMSILNWIITGNYFNIKYCYHTVPEIIDPFDFQKFKENATQSAFYAVASNIETGLAEYLRVTDCHTQIDAIRASSSLPIISSIVFYKNKAMLDGNVSDSIPFKFMDSIGFKKQVVILMRPRSYVKEKNKMLPLYKALFYKYPKFVQAVGDRHIRYNACLQELLEFEKQKKAFVFYPSKSLSVGRMEKNTEKIMELYYLGVKDAKDKLPYLLEFLGKC